uniref:Uncharacterized protein n=1 Tax=Trichogramma kaykai TaxID=54128 RepID=A0ABD2XQV4_9HYME
MAQDNQECVKKLKLLHRAANDRFDRIGYKFLRKLYPLIKNWTGRHPNLLDTFQHEEIDWLLKEAAKNIDNAMNLRFVKFVVRSGYTDEQPPRLVEDGNPISRRTTALHYVNGCNPEFVRCLFDIYARFDVNYTNEDGLTHFHLAFKYGLKHVVKKFLELDQDPNCLVRDTEYSPLYFAARYSRSKIVAEMLLRAGADPNLANAKGQTILHVICQSDRDQIE